MSLSKSKKDRENSKFVESSSRPNHAAVETFVGNSSDNPVNTTDPTSGISVSDGNSTYTPLNDGQTFEGTWEKRTTPNLIVSGASDKSFTFKVQFANRLEDITAGEIDSTLTYTYTANAINVPKRLEIARDYFRVIIENNSGENMTELRVQTSIGKFQPLASRLNAKLDLDADANVVRSIGTKITPNGIYVNDLQSGIYSAGSTTTPLEANGEFIGEWLDASVYANLSIFISSDQPYEDTFYTDSSGQTAGIIFDLSNDGVNLDFSFGVQTSSNPPFHFFKTKPFLQYMRLRYKNDGAAQSFFTLSVLAEASASPEPITAVGGGFNLSSLAANQRSAIFGKDENDVFKMIPVTNAGTDIDNSFVAVVSKSILVAEDSNGDYERIERVNNAAKVYVDDFGSGVSTRPNDKLLSGQISVPSGSAIEIPIPPIGIVPITRKLKLITNIAGEFVFMGRNSSVTQYTGFKIDDDGFDLDYGNNGDGANPLYLIAPSGAGSETTLNVIADTVDSSTGVDNPTRVFADDNSFAEIDSNLDQITISGFDSSAIPDFEDIQRVRIGVRARKKSGSSTQLTSHVATVIADAGNTTTITSPTVTANSNDFYIVSVARRDEFANIVQISNTMGFTSAVLIDDTLQESAESRTSVYYMVGTPLSNGTITAAFSQGADHSVISVTRIANVDKADPITAKRIFGANSSGGSYSGTLSNGIANGQYFLAVAMEQGTHVAASAPAGATEQAEDGSVLGNDQRMAIVTAPITTTGAFGFSGTVSGNADLTYVAVSLKPAPAADPTIRIENSEGDTDFDITLSSETENLFFQDITDDISTLDETTIDAMTLTISGQSTGAAPAEIDQVYLEVFSASDAVRVSYVWTGTED